jgi:hypothetical protein
LSDTSLQLSVGTTNPIKFSRSKLPDHCREYAGLNSVLEQILVLLLYVVSFLVLLMLAALVMSTIHKRVLLLIRALRLMS